MAYFPEPLYLLVVSLDDCQCPFYVSLSRSPFIDEKSSFSDIYTNAMLMVTLRYRNFLNLFSCHVCRIVRNQDKPFDAIIDGLNFFFNALKQHNRSKLIDQNDFVTVRTLLV